MRGLIGKKVGMTRVFNSKGNVIPVTVLEVGPCRVVQVKTVENDGYDAVQIGFMDSKQKHTTKPLAGHFSKNNVKTCFFSFCLCLFVKLIKNYKYR